MIPFKDNVGAGGVPVVTIAALVLCILSFGWQLTRSGSAESGDAPGISERDELAVKYGTSPWLFWHAGAGYCVPQAHGIECLTARFPELLPPGDVRELGQVAWWASPVTAFFVSADFLHLVVNLLFLWIFGRTLELTLGKLRYGGLLVLAAFAAVGVVAQFDHGSDLLILGTSNALAAVLGAYAVIYHRARVLCMSVIPLLGTLIEVPTLILIASWFLIALIPAVGAVVDPDLVAGLDLEFACYAVALALGALGGLLARGRRIDEPRPMPV